MEIDFSKARVIAHRGASYYAPENTMAAFKKAAAMGAEWIECDVMQTKDGEVVIFHDETLDRCTSGKGLLCSFTYDELEALDAGSWFESEFRGQRILKLETLVTFLFSMSMCANIELKAPKGKEAELAMAVLKILGPYLVRFNHRFLFSSFSMSALKELRALDKRLNIGLLLHQHDKNWQVHVESLDCLTVHLNKKILTPSLISDIKKINKKILVYTVNQITLAKQLFGMGVDGVFSDRPDLLHE